MMNQIDPIWKYNQLLDRLTRNDRRIIDCITAISRDYQHLAPTFVERLESKLFLSIEPLRKLLFLYVIDSLSFNIPIMREYLSMRVSGMFAHSYRMANSEVKLEMEKLLEIWEGQYRFPMEVLEDIREKMAPTPPVISSPIHTHHSYNLFDLSDLTDWLNQNSYAPLAMLHQSAEENGMGMFDKLLDNQRSKAEFEKLTTKLSVVDPNGLHAFLLYELYEELPKQCLMCGLRFSLDSEMDIHLDLHFVKNNKKEVMKTWLPDPLQWVDPRLHRGLLAEDVPNKLDKEVSSSAPCNPDQLNCLLCGEAFEIVPRDSAWFCKDAERIFVENQGKEVILHSACVESITNLQFTNLQDNMELVTQ